MPKFSKHFSLGLSQRELDFVDVNSNRDTPVYVDPYAIEIRDDVWAATASENIRGFFLEVLNALRAKDEVRARNLMSHLHEPAETFLGVSRGKPKGRGVGSLQSGQLIQAIKRSYAFETGLLSDLSEMALYVDGMDRDKISDLTTNVIRLPLVKYTQEQCALFGIPTRSYNGPPHWNNERKNWQSAYVDLPFIGKNAILLVPKYIVRRRLSLDSQEFYNKQITDFMVAENLRANSSLVQTIKGGKERKVFKKDVRAAEPKSKSGIASFVKDHPELLKLYKEIAKNTSFMSSFDDKEPSLQEVCRALTESLSSIKPGVAEADRYHRTILGALTVLFYPDLIQPHKEWEINDGRKRVDIVYTNAANTGFFAQRRDGAKTQANVIFVECKNYKDDIANKELDQLLGRFDDVRGKFGIVACRKIDNEALVLQRCRDMSKRSTGFIVVLSDHDIIKMLEHKGKLEDKEIENMLYEKYRKLLE